MKKSKPILLGFLYRNPAENIDWIERYISMMETINEDSKDIIMLGDFNIDLSKNNF